MAVKDVQGWLQEDDVDDERGGGEGVDCHFWGHNGRWVVQGSVIMTGEE